jgi:UDP-3-O-[3-hydroxymyristoyl] N-acetylglucosamine deacetylase
MTVASAIAVGRALHSGERGRVTLRAHGDPRAPVTIRVGDVEAPLARWRAVEAERSTWIALDGDGPRVRLVEHLLAALAGLGIHDGVQIDVEGSELPLLDGASGTWADALATLSVAPSVAGRVVAREATVDVGSSRYAFSPGPATRVRAVIEFDDARIAPEASWDGDRDDFVRRIAPARTFCFAREMDELARRGLAAHATPEAVIVIGEQILVMGRPFEADEPVRHKLLDVIGDLYLYGGPPRGAVRAFRPGHAATHAAMRIALERGIVR